MAIIKDECEEFATILCMTTGAASLVVEFFGTDCDSEGLFFCITTSYYLNSIDCNVVGS